MDDKSVLNINYMNTNAENTYNIDSMRHIDGVPSGRTHIGSLTRVMARRMEEEGVQKTLFLWRNNF